MRPDDDERPRSLGERIARAGGVARAMTARRGFVIHMFTGYFRPCEDGNCQECPPALYPTIDAALQRISRCPDWGRAAVDVFAAMMIPDGMGGRPDFVLGGVVANGSEAPPYAPRFYECGICDCYHPAGWVGDCREDGARFFADELDEKYGAVGWEEIPMPGVVS